MFVGHYGVGLAIKKSEPGIPLWALFIAVQFLDVARGGGAPVLSSR